MAWTIPDKGEGDSDLPPECARARTERVGRNVADGGERAPRRRWALAHAERHALEVDLA